MSNWGKFNNINAKALNEQSKKLKSGDFEEVPVGKYEIHIESLELKPTKEKGYPMLAGKFKIVQGDYNGRLIFMNQVIAMDNEHDAMRLGIANDFLTSLGTDVTLAFEDWDEYEELVNKIFDKIEDNGWEYLLEIKEKKGFRSYKICEKYA